MSDVDLSEVIEDCLHLATEVIEEHFGSMEDIRAAQQDREEVEYVKDVKIVSYEVILRELMRYKLRLHE